MRMDCRLAIGAHHFWGVSSWRRAGLIDLSNATPSRSVNDRPNISLHFFTALQRARPGSLNLENLLDAEVGFIFISSWTTGPPAKLSSPRGGMPRSQQARFEEAGGQRLPLGGINGYIGVRGKQGRRRDQFQGVTPQSTARSSSTQRERLPLHLLSSGRMSSCACWSRRRKKNQRRPPLAQRQTSSRSASTSATFTSHCRLLSRLCGPVPFYHRSKQTSQQRAVLLLRTPIMLSSCML